VHEHRHRISFASGQLLCLLLSSTSAADLLRPVMPCGNSPALW